MNLAQILGIDITKMDVILVGRPELTNLLTAEDEPYYSVKLLKPTMVRCSVDPLVDSFETEEVFVRKSAITGEGWNFLDEKNPEAGFFMPNWKIDFSKSHQVAVYQETTIARWSKTNRGDKRDENRNIINERIREKIAAGKSK